jgi:hypothetical protein
MLMGIQTNAHAADFTYPEGMPTPAEVREKIKGVDELETAGRQYGAFWQLQILVIAKGFRDYWRHRQPRSRTLVLLHFRIQAPEPSPLRVREPYLRRNCTGCDQHLASRRDIRLNERLQTHIFPSVAICPRFSGGVNDY